MTATYRLRCGLQPPRGLRERLDWRLSVFRLLLLLRA